MTPTPSSLVTLCICLLVLGALVPSAIAQESCYADCSNGLSAENDQGPAAGESAPDFTATLFEPATGVAAERTLEALLDGRPLILAFGSYT